MNIVPDKRLLRVVAAWTMAALVVVIIPALWVVLAAALGVVVTLVVWDTILLRRVQPIGIARQLPERAFVGRDATVTLQLQNDNSADVSLDLVEELPDDLARTDPQFADVVVAARSTGTVQYTICPAVRGDRRIGCAIVLMRSPLGFLRRRVICATGTPLRVYPDTSRYLRPEALDPKRVLAAMGVRPARQRGDGMEFESLRDYVPGDDPRRLDWAASARRGRPVTRLYQHERNHTVIVSVDASRLMAGRVGERSKLDYAVDAALALTYAALVSVDRVGMTVFDDTVHGHIVPRTHRHDFGQFVDLLRPVQPRLVEVDYRALVRHLAVQQRQRALIVVLTDFVEADAAALIVPLVVLARRHRVLLVAVRDRLYEALDPHASSAGDAPQGFYRRLVLNDLLTERESALATLRRAGLQTLDLTPEAMTAAVLNRYLAIRYGPER